jgi:hypothetical protein
VTHYKLRLYLYNRSFFSQNHFEQLSLDNNKLAEDASIDLGNILISNFLEFANALSKTTRFHSLKNNMGNQSM